MAFFKNKNYDFSKMPYAFYWLTLPDLQGSEKKNFPLEISHL